MTRRISLFGSTLLLVSIAIFAHGDDSKTAKRIAPRSAKESLAAFEIEKGFRIELAAAEPLVQSPMAAEFDEDGRLYVVELPEYNQYGSTKPHGKGRIVRLEDTDGDGVFDKRTVFADGLDYPTAVFPWGKGVFVGAAPDLLYFSGKDASGKATRKEVVLSGFGKDKAGEGQLNSFRWHLENRILISTGLDGGEVSRPDVKESRVVNVRAMNLLLDPRTHGYETTSGGGQHGMSMDDWGNVFVSGNSDPIHWLQYDARDLKLNPYAKAPLAAVNILPSGKFTRLHRISEIEPWRILRTQLRKDGKIPGSDEGGTPSGFFTGASGVTIYRGDAYPKEYRGNAFVGEVANNLVFRATIEDDHGNKKAVRAGGNKEFLASKDVWFRPVQFTQGPDGCLYVIDMYRELIEGAAFLAPEVLKNVDPSAGFDRGRIWRIVPEQYERRRPEKISTRSNAELVKMLESPNGWHRDTASRLLYERNAQASKGDLVALAQKSPHAVARLHALHALHRLDSTNMKVFREALRDPEPNLRAHALHILAQHGNDDDGALPKETGLQTDTVVVRAMAFAWDRIDPDDNIEMEIELLRKFGDDPIVRLGLISNFTRSNTREFLSDLRQRIKDGLGYPTAVKQFLREATEMIPAHPRTRALFHLVSIIKDIGPKESALRRELTRTLFRCLPPEKQRDLIQIGAETMLTELIADAKKSAGDNKLPAAERADMLRDLQLARFDEIKKILAGCLEPDQPLAVQLAAMETLGKNSAEEVAEMVLGKWKRMTPQLRATATELLLSRTNWLNLFLDAVENGTVVRADVDPARAALLKKSNMAIIRQRATKLFPTGGSATRAEVVDKYRPALKLQGDAAKGKAVFKNQCSSCHKLDGVGETIGADLFGIKDRGLENVLLNILDPNREVKPQFLTYQINLKDGRTLTGMIVAETAVGLTVRKADATSESIQRTEIDSLKSTGLSFMPEGLERQIDTQAMADLLAYLASVK